AGGIEALTAVFHPEPKERSAGIRKFFCNLDRNIFLDRDKSNPFFGIESGLCLTLLFQETGMPDLLFQLLLRPIENLCCFEDTLLERPCFPFRCSRVAWLRKRKRGIKADMTRID